MIEPDVGVVRNIGERNREARVSRFGGIAYKLRRDRLKLFRCVRRIEYFGVAGVRFVVHHGIRGHRRARRDPD